MSDIVHPDIAHSIVAWAERQDPRLVRSFRQFLPETMPVEEAEQSFVLLLLKQGVLSRCEACDAVHNQVECPHCSGRCGCAGGHGH